MIVKPFRGLRPRRDLAARVPSVPYDVVSRDEAREIAVADPHSFLHVVRAEIDLPAEVDAFDPRVYEKSRSTFQAMIERGWLVRDERPAYYVYRLRADDHTQTGIVGAAAVDDYLEGRIKKHENTRPDKEDDRVRVVQALGAHPGPVFLIYPTRTEIEAIVERVIDGEPRVSFEATDGVEHTLWVVDDPAGCEALRAAFERIPATYVADGHHRTAAAARACAEMRARLESPGGEESCHHFLAVHFPVDQVRVLDYNRVVRDLGGLQSGAFVAKLDEAGFVVRPGHTAGRAPRRGTFGMYIDGGWSLLEARPEILAADDVLARLDVSILSERVLRPLLGIEDPRTDPRIDFVGGSRGASALERRVDRDGWAVAFTLYPTDLGDLIDVADADRVMPPKSTWFEPKLRSGMVVQLLDGEL